MRTAIVVTVAALASVLGPSVVDDPDIPACAEDDHVSIEGTCVHPDTADYDHGYWRAET